MRLRGRLWLVVLVVCLGFVPARSDAATIGVSDQLLDGTDLVFIPFTITEDSLLSLDVTAGFVPIVTLFGPETDPNKETIVHPPDPIKYQWITEFQALALTNSIMVSGVDAWSLTGEASGTNYLLVLSQDPNLFEPFSPGGGWAADLNPGFLDLLAGFCTDPTRCTGSEQFVDASGVPGNGDYNATFDIAPAAVPEPATLSLVALGGAALAARRRRKRDEN